LIPADILSEVFSATCGPSEGLVLFGSFARGDATQESDVDVIQISPERKRSYACGRISVAVYTRAQLFKMARSGDLFAAHIAKEGQVLHGPQTFLSDLQEAFVRRANYQGLRDELRASLPLLDILPEHYKARSERYDSLAQFLLRSWVYSLAADAGEYVFSMQKVAIQLNDPRLLQIRKLPKQTWSTFRAVVSIAESYFGLTAHNPWATPEAYLVNTGPGLNRILGLRLLNDAGNLLDYESNESRL
jgi:hypothetical protein